MFIDAAAFKPKLVAVLQKAQLEVTNSWDSIIEDSVRGAWDDIVQALLKRGYTIAQIESWDAGLTYQVDIALYWCLVKGGCTKDYDETFIFELKRRFDDLETVAIVIEDEIPDEPAEGVGAVRSGLMKNNGDLFSF